MAIGSPASPGAAAVANNQNNPLKYRDASVLASKLHPSSSFLPCFSVFFGCHPYCKVNELGYFCLPWAQEVRGSNPRAPTNFFNNLRAFSSRWRGHCDVVCDVTPLKGCWLHGSKCLDGRPPRGHSRVRVMPRHSRVNMARKLSDYTLRNTRFAKFSHKQMSEVRPFVHSFLEVNANHIG